MNTHLHDGNEPRGDSVANMPSGGVFLIARMWSSRVGTSHHCLRRLWVGFVDYEAIPARA